MQIRIMQITVSNKIQTNPFPKAQNLFYPKMFSWKLYRHFFTAQTAANRELPAHDFEKAVKRTKVKCLKFCLSLMYITTEKTQNVPNVPKFRDFDRF